MILVGLVSVAARAQPLDRLEVREDSCITRQAVVTGLRSWLGREPFAEGDTLRVVVDAGPPTRFEVVRSETSAEREFPELSGRCEERVAALTLALALALDESLLSRLDLGSAEPVAEPTPSEPDMDRHEAPATPEADLAPSSPAARLSAPRPDELHVGLRLGVGAQLGPRPTFIGRAGLRVDRGRMSLGVGVSATSVETRKVASARVEARRTGTEMLACFVAPPSARWRPFACATVAVARVRARGIGFEDDRRLARPWVGLGANVGLRVGITEWADVSVVASAWGALVAPRLEVWSTEGVVDAWSLPRLGGDLQLELGVRFW